MKGALADLMFALGILAAGLAYARQYPTKPAHIIIPFTPGGGSDLIWRSIARKLGERPGQRFIVDNHPGAGGILILVPTTAPLFRLAKCLSAKSA